MRKIFVAFPLLLMAAFTAIKAADAQTEEDSSESPSYIDVEPRYRPVVESVLSYAIEGLKSKKLAAELTTFGLTDDTVGEIISTRLQESFSSGVADLSRDLAFNYATDIVAQSFADIMLESVYAENLPDKLKNPLRAMLEATVKEGFGIAESIVIDSGTVGPFALAFPILDRVQDVIEIHDAASGTVQARNATLMSAALGAETNAELLSRYPSAESDRVAYQWLEETKASLKSISNSEEYQSLASILEDGFSALTAVQANACDSECESAIERLRLYQSGDSNGLKLNPVAPIETSLRLLGGYDPTESLAQSMLELTSLQSGATPIQSAKGQTITVLNQRPIQTLDDIQVRITGVPKNERGSNLRYWVTLVRQDARIGSWAQWYWVDGGDPVTLEFRSQEAGGYELRLHDHWSDRRNLYEKVYARTAFTVRDRSPGNVSVVLDFESPAPIYSPIEARVKGTDPKLRYWITLLPKKLPVGNYKQWRDLERSHQHTVRFGGQLPGDYELRIHDYRPGYALVARTSFSVSWDVGANSQIPSCPSTYRGNVEKMICRCDGKPSGTIWGTDFYTSDSSICLAAAHSRLIDPSLASDKERIVMILRQEGRKEYTGSLRNGIRSKPWGDWHTSFVVKGMDRRGSAVEVEGR